MFILGYSFKTLWFAHVLYLYSTGLILSALDSEIYIFYHKLLLCTSLCSFVFLIFYTSLYKKQKQKRKKKKGKKKKNVCTGLILSALDGPVLDQSASVLQALTLPAIYP